MQYNIAIIIKIKTDDSLIELSSKIGDLVIIDYETIHKIELCLNGKMTGKETEIVMDINSKQFLPTECIKILDIKELNKWMKFLPICKHINNGNNTK